MSYLYIIGLLIPIVITQQIANNPITTLKQLFIIYRHGDRSPITLYPTDPNPESSWPDGLGELTNIGKEQHYFLGQFLRVRYDGFLTDNLRELSVRSSNKNRCLDSAQCNLASLYSPNGAHVWNKELLWQPVPVHTEPEIQDNICTMDPICPEYEKEIDRIKQRSDVKDFMANHKELFDFMSNNSGSNVADWVEASYIFNTLYIESLYKLLIPQWALNVWDEMSVVEDYSFYVRYSSRVARRLRGGPLLGDIISKMENKVSGDASVIIKAFMYSTHDDVVAALLSAVGVFNNKSPPYCSTVLVELHENGPHNHTVRMYYRNSTEFDGPGNDDLNELIVPGCEFDCPLGHFIRLTQDSVPVDWKEECGIQMPTKPFSQIALLVIVSLGVVVFLLILSTVVMLWLRCQKQQNGVRYQRVPVVQ